MSERKSGPIVSVSGVRGVVGVDLHPEDVARWGAAFGTLCPGGRILVGRDARTSGPMMQAALTAGLLSAGVDTVDLGVCPTPTVQMAVPEASAAGGVGVTASHNPPEWNALKFIGPSGRFLNRAELDDLVLTLREGSFRRSAAGAVGRMSSDSGALDLHIRRILELDILDVGAIRGAGLRVAVDACNGAGSAAAPALLEALGCRVPAFNCDGSGAFAGRPEPTPPNLDEF